MVDPGDEPFRLAFDSDFPVGCLSVLTNGGMR